MAIRKRLAGFAAATALAASAVALGGATPAQASTHCPGPEHGSMCVHIHNTDNDTWYWFGEWTACTVHNIPVYDQVTWVEDNQYTGTVTTFYYGRDGGGGAIGTMTAPTNGRPPGYVDSDLSYTQSIRVC
jgi:hypothetical protein